LNSELEDILERKQSIIQRVELFKLLQIEKQIEELEEYALKHGDFFIRDEDGEVVRDGFGNPLSRKVVLDKRDLEFLKDLEAAREINRRILAESDEVRTLEAEKKASDIIDVEEYFDEK
jgi:hypothetical protein